jgi:D-amino-acid dehydrogenase
MTGEAGFAKSARSDRVVVVGGGVIGAASAYYLHLAGRAVTLLDAGLFGRGCSHGNCGYVCPSHILPLAGPGAIGSTLKTLFQRNSPLKVRWRLDPAMWTWFWQFARRCNTRDAVAAGHAIQPLLDSSRTLYDELFQGTLIDCEWEPLGLLFVFLTSSAMEHYAETDRLLLGEFGLGANRIEPGDLASLEPALKPTLSGAWQYQSDGQLRPDRLMAAWRGVLEAAGVEIREHCALVDFETEARLVRRLITTNGLLAADQIVVATGAWTPKLRAMLRCSVPIQPGKGYSITLPRPALCPRTPMIFDEHRVAISPMQSGLRVGSTMEFAGYDSRLNPARLRLLRESAALYFKEPLAGPTLEEWWGWRPMTPDGLPLIGPIPAFDNLFLAAGHGTLGVSMSPATGKLVAELMTGLVPHIDENPYSVSRLS